MKVLVCDDEPLAVERIGDLLAMCEGVETVGSATNGYEVLDLTRRLQPDLLLLDVEMPRLDGFDVVEELNRDKSGAPPLIVFVTAYSQFASLAFETGALDFLCKPVRLGRLERALARAHNALADREAAGRLEELARQLEALRAEHRQPKEDSVLWVQRRGETVRVNLAQVEWIEAEGEYIRLHLGNHSYLHRDLLSTIMKQLDPARFLRVHRSFAVNCERVASIRRSVNGGSRLVLDTGVELPVGRTYRKAVKSSLVKATTAEAAVTPVIAG